MALNFSEIDWNEKKIKSWDVKIILHVKEVTIIK